MREGAPVWVIYVAGSSRGKTEMLVPLDGLPGVRVTGSLTVAALLSGTSRKDRAKTATGGLLRELGDEGILVVKDLGAILTLRHDAQRCYKRSATSTTVATCVTLGRTAVCGSNGRDGSG